MPPKPLDIVELFIHLPDSVSIWLERDKSDTRDRQHARPRFSMQRKPECDGVAAVVPGHHINDAARSGQVVFIKMAEKFISVIEYRE